MPRKLFKWRGSPVSLDQDEGKRFFFPASCPRGYRGTEARLKKEIGINRADHTPKRVLYIYVNDEIYLVEQTGRGVQ
jgi:hypothetical protein